MRKLLTFIIASELICAGFLVKKVPQLFNDALGDRRVEMAYLPADNFLFLQENPDLPNFYENIPNTEKLSLANGFRAKAIQTINTDGLNERDDYLPSKPPGVFRIITLGDSFTEGIYVETKDNYSERLEDFLNQKLECKHISQFEVINLAVLGYDIEYGINRFRSKGAKYNPDLLTWLLKEDDFISVNKYVSRKYHSYGEKYRQNSPDEAWLRAYNEVLQEYGEANLIKYQYEKLGKFLGSLDNKVLLVTYQSTSPSIQALLKLLALNSQGRYLLGLWQTSRFPDGHPDIGGHQQIAEQLFNYLVRQNIVQCKLKEEKI